MAAISTKETQQRPTGTSAPVGTVMNAIVPATGGTIGTIPVAAAKRIPEIAVPARAAQQAWGALRFAERVKAPTVRRNVATASPGERLHSALSSALGTSQWTLVDWNDEVRTGPGESRFTVRLADRAALAALVSTNPERGFGRAYATGQLDIEPLWPFLELAQDLDPRRLVLSWPKLLMAALSSGVRPRGIPRSTSEAHLRGPRHTLQRDADAIRHHYDLPVEFYQLWLDPTLTYSCAYFRTPDVGLDAAQVEKLDLVCRKLRLVPGERLLDIGSGWGSLALHAAANWGVQATGITNSPTQAQYASARARELGLEGRVDFQLRDYRELGAGGYDAVASIGMVEHVGREKLPLFAAAVNCALRPGGRALVHGITDRPGGRPMRGSFLDAFVFPDGDLQEISFVVRTLERAGLEVRDVEDLREHYALTLKEWVARLEARFDAACDLVGPERARVWRLYMTGAAVAFTTGKTGIHQTLAVKVEPDGLARVPLTREGWYNRVGPNRVAQT